MPSTQRHSRLSQPSNSSQNGRPRQPRKARARTVRELVKALEKEEQVEKKQRDAESRQLDQYMNMALRHLPADDVLEDLPESLWRKFITTCILAVFFRSACSSSKEIEAMALTILNQLQAGKIDDEEKNQIESRVCGFLLGECGVDVSKTLEEADFCGTSELKKLFFNDWKNDVTFTAHSKCDVKSLLRIRQRLTEKLNSMLYTVFEQQRGTESAYVKALKKASQKIQATMIVANPLPADYLIEVRFGKEVCRILRIFDIVKEWAGNYGQEPSRNLIMRLPTILNNRAIKKQQESINAVAERLIKMIKENRSEDEDNESFSMSQPSLFLSQIQRSPPISQKRYQSEIQALCDLTHTDDDEEESSSEDLMTILEKEVPGFDAPRKRNKTSIQKRKQSPPQKGKTKYPPKASPPQKQKTILPPKPSPPQKSKPIFPRKRKRTNSILPTFTVTNISVPSKRSSTSDRESKRPKTTSLFDGLPELEEI